MSHTNWQEHFKVKLQGLTHAFEHSGSTLSLLGFALKNEYLTSEEYLNWASRHFGLPLLNAGFFAANTPNTHFFSKFKSTFNWSPECLPLGEWDGALIIAGVQPPQELPNNLKFIFVLAAFENLESTWSALQIPALPTVDVAPDGLDLFTTTSMKKAKDDDSFSFEDLQIDSEVTEIREEIGAFDGDLLAPSEDQGGMEGLDESIVGSFNKPISDAESFDASSLVIPESTPDNMTEDAPLATVTVLPSLEQRESKIQIADVRSYSDNFHLRDLMTEKTYAIGNKIKATLAQMKSHFEKSLILSLNDTESSAIVFAWDESFNGEHNDSYSIPLNTPSIFNIVAATSKPFHGFVSLNEINEKFFEEWNHGAIPDHVTITPILLDVKVVGMLVGFAEKSAYNRASLNLAEKLALQLMKDFQVA